METVHCCKLSPAVKGSTGSNFHLKKKIFTLSKNWTVKFIMITVALPWGHAPRIFERDSQWHPAGREWIEIDAPHADPSQQ
jgi:hypothetical protein